MILPWPSLSPTLSPTVSPTALIPCKLSQTVMQAHQGLGTRYVDGQDVVFRCGGLLVAFVSGTQRSKVCDLGSGKAIQLQATAKICLLWPMMIVTQCTYCKHSQKRAAKRISNSINAWPWCLSQLSHQRCSSLKQCRSWNHGLSPKPRTWVLLKLYK